MSTPNVRLDPMTEAEYQSFVEKSIVHYAEEKTVAGAWKAEDSLRQSREEFDQLLPGGLGTPDNHLSIARDAQTDARVGVFWLTIRAHAGAMQAYIYEIEVDEEVRGQGYGRAVMVAGADQARSLGADTIALHVFGHNKVARSLYNSLGYVETDVSMSLKL